jgi:hypothetical protein
MSLEVGIHLWLGDGGQINPIAAFRDALECIQAPSHKDIDGRAPNRFNRLLVKDRSRTDVVCDRLLNTNDLQPVLTILEKYDDLHYSYEMQSAYDCVWFNPQTQRFEASIRPLQVTFYGPKFGWKGYEYKSFGAIHFRFHSVKDFHDHPNQKILVETAKRLVEKSDPIHLVCCTEIEVHPLTSHIIYHRYWPDYFNDLIRIANMHERGGVYFSDLDIKRGEPGYWEPRKDWEEGYGYLRSRYKDAEASAFKGRIQKMVDAIIENPQKTQAGTEESLKQCFTGLQTASSLSLGQGTMLIVKDLPFAYLEEPYFKLFSLLYD